MKFRELAERARALGFDAVCTGHYARRVDGISGPELHRGLDEDKDQSYVLAVMGDEELERVILPLGDAPNKAWVRRQAEIRGLGVSNKPDSYDICFIPDGDTAGFLRRNLGDKPGKIIDTNGQVVGEHKGSYQFTVGQRRGLRLGTPAADGKPRYVLATDPKTNTVVVGAGTLLSVDRLTGVNPVLYVPPELLRASREIQDSFGSTINGRGLNEIPSDVLTVQIRAHGVPSVVKKVHIGEGVISVDLAEPIRGVAAGQSLVVYRGSRVVAEATIESASRVQSPQTSAVKGHTPAGSH